MKFIRTNTKGEMHKTPLTKTRSLPRPLTVEAQSVAASPQCLKSPNATRTEEEEVQSAARGRRHCGRKKKRTERDLVCHF